MKRTCIIATAIGLLMLAAAASAWACTTMIVTRGASADGSMMVAHSDDDELGDQRLILVPGRKQEGKRKIFHEKYRYPRFVTDDRGPAYNTPGFAPTVPVYELPYKAIWKILGHEVPQSYAYYDGNYGIMNEHNLMMGECTNGAKYEPKSNPKKNGNNPRRIFYSSELSRIALENCKTAREAVTLMGGLLDEYGYYSTGETLLVADQDEAWVFEMCALPDATHHSAWVAKRVPDGHFFVAANEFRIRTVIRDDPDNFLYSEHLIPGLKKLGWWNEKKDGPIDWLRAVSPGEYNHPYYSLRRVWRVLDRVNPDLGLSPWVEDDFTKAYPFAVRPKAKLTPHDVFGLYRDHYEGTQFDMTKGVAAGPYGDPHRFVGPYDGNQNDVTEDKKYYGAWERAISVFYQGYTFVCQTRPKAPEFTRGLVWFGPDVSYTTCFTPFFAKASALAGAYQTGSPQKYDPAAAWWRFNLLANWSRLNFERMTRVDIQPVQQKLERKAEAEIQKLDKLVENQSPANARTLITEFGASNAMQVLARWQDLTYTLFAKYSDGYINLPDLPDGRTYATPPLSEGEKVRMIGYPSTWLDKTDYRNGPTSYDMK
ncbi:dipeptidase [Pseudodesulfovibrio tunisiensis]|uniref:dipeptidase n=1 Tax=Pseudodesulfovibrio tunisiensis TaxID=463192 RepID=UPI001FB54268|nr:C69 family dipeptidase [Pseudodesulfovibrio tunisiensis]